MNHADLLAPARRLADKTVTVHVSWSEDAARAQDGLPYREARRVEDMGAELFAALEAEDYSHLDPELNRLLG